MKPYFKFGSNLSGFVRVIAHITSGVEIHCDLLQLSCGNPIVNKQMDAIHDAIT